MIKWILTKFKSQAIVKSRYYCSKERVKRELKIENFFFDFSICLFLYFVKKTDFFKFISNKQKKFETVRVDQLKYKKEAKKLYIIYIGELNSVKKTKTFAKYSTSYTKNYKICYRKKRKKKKKNFTFCELDLKLLRDIRSDVN